MAKTKTALKILDRVTGNNESVKAGIVQAKINFEVAPMTFTTLAPRPVSPRGSSRP